MLVQKKMKGNVLVREMGNSHAERGRDGQGRGPGKQSSQPAVWHPRHLAKLLTLGSMAYSTFSLINSPLYLSEFE